MVGKVLLIHKINGLACALILVVSNGLKAVAEGLGESSCNRWVAGSIPCSIHLRYCVREQDTLPELPADGDQMVQRS